MKVQIRFDGPPSAQSGRFVEVERVDTGESIKLGEWVEDSNGHWLLQFHVPARDIQYAMITPHEAFEIIDEWYAIRDDLNRGDEETQAVILEDFHALRRFFIHHFGSFL